MGITESGFPENGALSEQENVLRRKMEVILPTAAQKMRSFAVRLFPAGNMRSSAEGRIPELPPECRILKIAVRLVADRISSGTEAVFRVSFSQEGRECARESAAVIRIAFPSEPLVPQDVIAESCVPVEPGKMLHIRVERISDDPGDTFPHAVGLISMTAFPVQMPFTASVVQDKPGYNSWPMIQAMGKILVCAYSCGSAHSITEEIRGVYARTSADGGKTWGKETRISNSPDCGEVTIGKGLDADGAMLLWVRSWGGKCRHDLCRSADGVHFTRIAAPELDPLPIQITDIFKLPGGILASLWFAGSYQEGNGNSWGMLTSSDNGATWRQSIVESGLSREEWPTEPSAVSYGNGRIFAIARTEIEEDTVMRTQFQLESVDCGRTWTRRRTNIGDVGLSTPSLIYDEKTGLLSNYYYHRGRGVLKRRVVPLERIAGNPLAWPDPELLVSGSADYYHAGNVNVTAVGNTHYAAFYSGSATDTVILSAALPAPRPADADAFL